MKNRWLFWLFTILLVWLIVGSFIDFTKISAVLVHIRLFWLVVAVLLQLVYYLLYSGLYYSAFDTVEINRRIIDLLVVILGSLFINVVAPRGKKRRAASLYVEDATRRGESPVRAAAGTLLVLVADFAVFSVLIITAFFYLILQYELRLRAIVVLMILMTMVVIIAISLFFGLWQPIRLHPILRWLQRAVNRLGGWFGHPALLHQEWVEQYAASFTETAMAISLHPPRLTRTLMISFTARLVDLICLYTIFQIFQPEVSFGVVLVGYSAGILLWVVSPIPQGIGLVEAIMTITYIWLKVPGEIGFLSVLLFRGLTFWLPLLLGFLLLRRVKPVGPEESTRIEAWSVKAVALLTAFTGIVNMLSAVTPALVERIRLVSEVLPLEVRRSGRLSAAIAGFALLLLAGSLWRRKRVAWLLTIVVLVIAAISHLLKGLDYEEASLAFLLVIWLCFQFPRFHARSDSPSIRQGIRVLIYALVFTVAYGVTGFYLLDKHFSVNFGFGDALRQTIIMFTEFYDPGLEPITGFGRYFAASIYAVGAMTLGYAFIMLVRPVFIHQPATAQDRLRAQKTVANFGNSALARFTLFDDKSYYFSPGGSVISFVKKGRIALTLGDPIGPAEDSLPAIDSFLDYCSHNDWQTAFYQVMPNYLKHYQDLGLNVICIGHEAIIDLAAFKLEGNKAKSLRTSANRLNRLEYRAEIHAPPLPDQLIHELRLISDEWLTMVHGTEMRFSMGSFEEDYLCNTSVIVIRSQEGIITAFANIVSEYQKNELTVDLMRRRHQVEPGTMEFLFIKLFQWAKEQGYDSFNLGFSALAGVGEEVTDPAVERALRYIYKHINQFYNFKGLHAFKEKFNPQWSPRYLVYPGTTSLPAILTALILANTGDGFLWRFLKQ